MKLRSHKKNKKIQRILSVLLALSVVLVEGTWDFSFAEAAGDATSHRHGADCYAQQLVCGLEEHTEGCYGEKQKLTCGLEENQSHAHGQDCYTAKKELVCALAEHGHVHTADCYGEVLTCGLDASMAAWFTGAEDAGNPEGDRGTRTAAGAPGEAGSGTETGNAPEENGAAAPGGNPENRNGAENGGAPENGSAAENSGAAENGGVVENSGAPEAAGTDADRADADGKQEGTASGGTGTEGAAPETTEAPTGNPGDINGTENDSTAENGNTPENGGAAENGNTPDADADGTDTDGKQEGSAPGGTGTEGTAPKPTEAPAGNPGDINGTENDSTAENGNTPENGGAAENGNTPDADADGTDTDGKQEGSTPGEEDGAPEDGNTSQEEDTTPGEEDTAPEDTTTPEGPPGTEEDPDGEAAEEGEEEAPGALPDETKWAPACGNEEEDHIHTQECYERIYCGQKSHVHTDTCYDASRSLTCGEEEHSHTSQCFLTEEIRAEIQRINQLIQAIPAYEEIETDLTALQEDGEAYAAYLLGLTAQVEEAYTAYLALPEELRQYVEGAEYLLLLSGMLSGTTLENSVMGPDDAYVNTITVKNMTTGTAPFDDIGGRGNDTTAEDRIVRTFDSVTYHFEVNMMTWDITKTYNDARVKLEFVLPRTEEEAVFDQSAMGWMDTTEDYAPTLTKETRTIDGQETECQVLTCYKRLLPAGDNRSVVPGNFGENLTIYVRSMHNGDTFAPIISAAMEGGTWEGACENEGHVVDGEPVMEKKTVVPEPVTVTAAPRYNIQLDSESSYRGTFAFQGDEAWMQQYGNIAANTDITQPVPGRLMKLGITLQLYNDKNPAKGLKGIELPQGDIEFDLEVSSVYTPTATSEHGERVDTTAAYTPLLWSYGENREIPYGESNTDGRVLYDRNGCLDLAPYHEHDENREGSDCWDSGTWKAVQKGTTIHITVSDYEIDLEHMPTRNLPGGAELYTPNIGCFSSGGIWLVQPFNKKDSQTGAEGPEYDIIKEYGAGAFATTAEAKNLQGTTESGEPFQEGENDFSQSVTTDDREVRTLELNLPGAMQNRVRYAGDHDRWWLGSGVDDIYDGNDYATVGDELYLVGGFSYDSSKEEGNQLYLGTNLIRFYGSAIELTGEGASNLLDGASLNGHSGESMKKWWEEDPTKENIRIYYATKEDGTDWTGEWEMQHTYEDGLVFYSSLKDIPEGKICVGILTCFIGPGPEPETDVDSGSYYYYHQAHVRADKTLAGKWFALVSTSRVWTREMFEQAEKELSDIGLGTESEVNIRNWIVEGGMLDDLHYKSANIEGSTWYIREEYREDGSGAEGKHNSEWEHWGDTLLIIGYRTSITKHLMQKASNGDEKNNFNLDAGQRVADFMLQPRTYYEKTGDYDHTATITIVDVLPQYMTYKPGTAYFGGKYQQTSPDGGTKGTIIKDTDPSAAFPDPELTEPAVTNNADGTQTLTWVIPDVKIGAPMAPIYYSADIGDSGNPGKDVPIGTTNLRNTATITAPDDLRDPLTTAEKHSEAGIAVTRGTADSFGKYTKQKVVEEDGEIDYVIYFNNNADTEAELAIMDTMPANGINGSDFTGTYTFAEWKLDVTKCEAGNLKIYYTFDEQYQDKTTKQVKKEEIEGTNWTAAEIAEDGNIQIPTPPEGRQHPVAWAVVGKLGAKKSVYIDLKISLKPDPSTPDRDKSNYFVNLLSSGDTITITENPTVRRTLEGLAWMDYDRDGSQGTGKDEPRIQGVQVELLKRKEPGDPEAEASYEAVCYPGTTTPIAIQTGQQISVRARGVDQAVAYAPDGEPGHYKFLDLPAGTFAVRFTDGTGETKISQLNPTRSNVGADDKDSDGIPVFDEKGELQKTVILNLNMPRAEEMSVTLYESKYHDSGFYPDTLMKIQKVDDTGRPLAGALFTVRNGEGEPLSFAYREGEGYYLQGYESPAPSETPDGTGAAQCTTELRVDDNGKLNIHNLLPGDYTITEVEAPHGYTLLGTPVELTLKMEGTESRIELRGDSVDNSMVSLQTQSDGIWLNIRNLAMYELPSTGGSGTGTYAAAGLLLMAVSAAYALLRGKKNPA
nr:SpaA isopeptide-forming pilin-related protein [uncultured Acetatifactor sp.]